MQYDYRAFGECQKIIMTDGDALDLTGTTAASQTIATIVPKVRYNMCHVLTLVDTVLAGVQITNDINAGTYGITLAGQCQVVAVKALTVTSGQIEVFLFA